MRTIIAGSRSAVDYSQLISAIEHAKNITITTVVSGTARGADMLGEQYAVEHGIPLKKFPADWDTWGKAAGYRRNAEMAGYGDALIALWDGESRGTKNMIDLANRHGLVVFVYNLKDRNGS